MEFGVLLRYNSEYVTKKKHHLLSVKIFMLAIGC